MPLANSYAYGGQNDLSNEITSSSGLNHEDENQKVATAPLSLQPLTQSSDGSMKSSNEYHQPRSDGGLQPPPQQYLPQPVSQNRSGYVNPSASTNSDSFMNLGLPQSAFKVSKSSNATVGHNDSEKKYRNNINSHFQLLRSSVPTLRWCDDNSIPVESLEGLAPPSKVNKVQILSKSHEYIKHLEHKNMITQQENEQLRQQLSQFIPRYQTASMPSNLPPPSTISQPLKPRQQSLATPPASTKPSIALAPFYRHHSPNTQINQPQGPVYAIPTASIPTQATNFQYPKYQNYYQQPSNIDQD